MRSPWSILLLAAACTAELPPIEPARLACTDDSVLPSGERQCPADSTCVDGSCRLRLDCRDPDRINCTPDETICEPILRAETAAVRCTAGVTTSTKAVRPSPVEPRCPELSYEVAFADGPPPDRYPLFLLPTGGVLPSGLPGVSGERTEWRRCAVACSSEANCPADHSCRPAAVITDGFRTAPSGDRFTIGVCYPNRLEPTRTSTSLEEFPEPRQNACRQSIDCNRAGRSGNCRYDVDKIADHPTAPAQSAWGERYALYAQCTNQQATSLLEEGIGCERGDVCKSGVCFGRCGRPCDPYRPAEGCGPRECVPRLAERSLGNGQVVTDLVHICELN